MGELEKFVVLMFSFVVWAFVRGYWDGSLVMGLSGYLNVVLSTLVTYLFVEIDSMWVCIIGMAVVIIGVFFEAAVLKEWLVGLTNGILVVMVCVVVEGFSEEVFEGLVRVGREFTKFILSTN